MLEAYGTMDWFQIGKGVHQGCILSPCLFNIYAEYIMWNSRLDEAQAGTKIAGRNISNPRYVDESVQFSCSVVSDSLRPHGLQHARLPCLSPMPRAYSNPCPSRWWCHPTISSSVVPFSSCPQSFLASRSFPMSQFFTSSGHSIGVSASASVLPVNTQDWSPLAWTGWISFSQRDSQESSPTPLFKSINSSALSLLCGPTLTTIYDHWKNHSFN